MSRQSVVVPADAPAWAQRLQTDLNKALAQVEISRKPKTFAKAAVPADGSETVAIISDDTTSGGPVLAFFDGSQWRRSTDRGVIS